eukprot:14836922-Heterocapsa_arctica.AAC.1
MALPAAGCLLRRAVRGWQPPRWRGAMAAGGAAAATAAASFAAARGGGHLEGHSYPALGVPVRVQQQLGLPAGMLVVRASGPTGGHWRLPDLPQPPSHGRPPAPAYACPLGPPSASGRGGRGGGGCAGGFGRGDGGPGGSGGFLLPPPCGGEGAHRGHPSLPRLLEHGCGARSGRSGFGRRGEGRAAPAAAPAVGHGHLPGPRDQGPACAGGRGRDEGDRGGGRGTGPAGRGRGAGSASHASARGSGGGGSGQRGAPCYERCGGCQRFRSGARSVRVHLRSRGGVPGRSDDAGVASGSVGGGPRRAGQCARPCRWIG